jgi:hypothetical protein
MRLFKEEKHRICTEVDRSDYAGGKLMNQREMSADSLGRNKQSATAKEYMNTKRKNVISLNRRDPFFRNTRMICPIMAASDSLSTIRIRDRAIIQLCFNLGMPGAKAFEMCSKAFPLDHPSRALVYERYKFHREGGRALEEEQRGGNTRDWDMVADIGAYVDQFPSVSVRSIAKELEFARSTIASVLRDTLHIAPLRPKFIAHELSPSNKQQRVNDATDMLEILIADAEHDFQHIITGDETMVPLRNDEDYEWAEIGTPRPLVGRPDYHPRKVMLSVFWSVQGFLVLDLLPPKVTINATYFQKNILDPLKDILKPKESDYPIWLHYDNCPAHRAKTTTAHLAQLGFHRMPHPAYSPDLAPCDFYLFSTVKRKLKGYVATTDAEIAHMFNQKLLEITREERLATMGNWMKRLRSVIETGGEVCF